MVWVRRTIWSGALIVSAWLGASAAGGVENPTTAPVDSKELPYHDLLQKGVELAKAKRPQEAIDDCFDKVIAFYRAKFAGAKAQLFCSHSQSETLLYALSGAGKSRETLVLQPDWCDALYDKGYALIDLNRLTEAEDSINQALALAPENSRYLGELGHIFTVRKQWAEAIKLFVHAEQAAKLAPPGEATIAASRACRGIGYALTEQGKLDESEANYRRCLTLDPADRKSMLEIQYIQKLRHPQ